MFEENRLSICGFSYLCRTDPRDVARVESKTWMVTKDKYDSVCHTPEGTRPIMGQWMSEEQFGKELDARFPGCMAGRPMYVVPFSMGPIGGPLSKIGIELTDSSYVVLCMKIMTRMGAKVLETLGDDDFVRCVHSVGLPRPVKQKVINHWPCNPDKVMIAHRPVEREIWSFGSGYGGNSLLGKKCFALRIACNIGYDEGWMAEHMLIMGITNPEGKERFVAAAFPSACGKTNLAMLTPSLPGFKVRVVGDDIAWMKFGDDGRLYAINPEAGFFGVAPGTSRKTNPMAVASFQKNSIFTNVAETSDGEYFWEGLEKDLKEDRKMTEEQLRHLEITNWLGEKWHIGDEGCPPELTFHSPSWSMPNHSSQIGKLHKEYQSMPLFSEVAVPKEYPSYSRVSHGNMEFSSVHLSSQKRQLPLNTSGKQVPKIFHVNWFRETKDHKFLWPGFGENIRVLDWILRRVDGTEDIAEETPIGYIPKRGSINLDGIPRVDWNELMSIPKDYWKEDIDESKHFLECQVGPDLPKLIADQLDALEKRIHAM
ncbi:phosphoenolpyruvate carboxykinase [Ostertagia ostertagi]